MTAFWLKDQEELIRLNQKSSPLYVYDLATVAKNFLALKNLSALHAVHYAVKANFHPQIIELLAKLGAGFDCVNADELAHIRKLAPQSDVVFTPNFAPSSEYKKAFATPKTWVTVDNPWLLRQHPEIFRGKEIFLRIDPDYSAGHHPHVQTSGKLAKFGILVEDLQECIALCRKLEMRVIGLHAHVGSGIDSSDSWTRCLRFLLSLTSEFSDLQFLDLGGGLPNADQLNFDLQAMNRSLLQCIAEHPKASHLKVLIEPGRFIVADAGVILTRVTQIKEKAGRLFIGIDAGMNTLIRPALYSAQHAIFKLGSNEKATWTADIVGPICETADTMARAMAIAPCKEGDTLLISHCGAYARAMASNYNSRPFAEEIVIP